MEKTPVMVCPTCGERHECQTAVGSAAFARARPAPGCLMLCIECGEICVLGDDMQMRRLTEAEAQTLPPEMVKMLADVENARQTVLRRHGRSPFGGAK